MTRFKLSRRTVIRGAGTVAIALPWLEVMGLGRRAGAQTTSVPLKRLVTVYQPGGAVRSGANGDKYTPTGSETSFTLSPILAPLQPMQSRMIVVDGLNLTCGDQGKYSVEQHQGGSVGLFTGAIQQGAGNYPGKMYPSIDQVLAPRLSAGKGYGSLQLAVRWATGKSHGKLSPMNALYFSDCGADSTAAGSAGHLHDVVRHTGERDGRDRRNRPERARVDAQEVDPGLRRQEVQHTQDQARHGRSARGSIST